jgi:hypothetical protein
MIRLVLVILLTYLLSILCFLAIKVTAIFFVVMFYGVNFSWGGGDTRFVIVRGSLMACVFGVFAIVQYIKTRKDHR